MSEEAIQKMFQPYQQADKSTIRKHGGTGLGLVICKDLIKLMDGEIWVESKEKQGSTFYFTILIKKADADYVGDLLQEEMEIIRSKKIFRGQ